MTGLEITSPNAGDKIDIQQGLPISWIVEDTDNLTANVDIQLYWNERFQVGLTWSEPGSTVPINDSSYTFQYTRDKDYIWPKTDYVVYLFDGSNSTHKTGEFEIFNTDGRVTSTTSMPTATQKGSKRAPRHQRRTRSGLIRHLLVFRITHRALLQVGQMDWHMTA